MVEKELLNRKESGASWRFVLYYSSPQPFLALFLSVFASALVFFTKQKWVEYVDRDWGRWNIEGWIATASRVSLYSKELWDAASQ